MTSDDTHIVHIETLNAGDAQAIEYLKREVASGRHWYPALLGAIGLWASAEEFYNGRVYTYLIDGEAFDWLVLAERLTETIKSYIPEKEREELLFNGLQPQPLEPAQIKELIGDKKYTMFLNYFYGITIEEALQLAVQAEVEKEKHVQGLGRRGDYSDDAFRRIYDEEKDELIQQFRKEKAVPGRETTSLGEMKQFTYWLFKYRFKRCEKARIASDTKKALNYLHRIWQRKGVHPALSADIVPQFPE